MGWPFSAALILPLAFFDILFPSSTTTTPSSHSFSSSNQSSSEAADTPSTFLERFTDWFIAALLSLVLILIPLAGIDYLYYRKLTLVPFNIVVYNVFSGSSDRGPDIYGTEPWHFYFVNLFLNFNFASLAALASLPLLVNEVWWRES